MATVAQIMGIIDMIAPAYYKMEKDKIGLQVGDPNARVSKILVALEVTQQVVDEAKEQGAGLIVSHHPLIYKGLENVVANDYIGGLVTGLIKSEIAVLVAHTNLDRAVGGVSDALAKAIGLKDTEVLVAASDLQMFKLVVFVPVENTQELISAVGDAGGGVIGNYSHCTFRSGGTGTFYPMQGARPYLGETGALNQVEEERLEVLVSGDKIRRVIQAMLAAHPYEEVAYDIYEVKNAPVGVGLGRVGNLDEDRNLRQCVEAWEKALNSRLKVSGDLNIVVKRVAVCGGSGAELMRAAKSAGADVYITGDIKYHAAHDAVAMGLAVVDAGHGETERLVVPELAGKLQHMASSNGLDVEVVVSRINTIPWIM